MQDDGYPGTLLEPQKFKPDSDIDGLGARLAECRKRKGLEQQELAILARVPAPSISHFERGRRKPSVENLVKLADALTVSVDFLVGRTDAMHAHVSAPLEIPAEHSQLTKREAVSLMRVLSDYVAAGAEPDAEEPPKG
ncbi:MAG: helix-turn-helix transcriptional regulator [Rhodospirillaceae bacterium]|nr:helix-turn-helix transcriptional regulator [Rhodospirillaceae bacterium]